MDPSHSESGKNCLAEDMIGPDEQRGPQRVARMRPSYVTVKQANWSKDLASHLLDMK